MLDVPSWTFQAGRSKLDVPRGSPFGHQFEQLGGSVSREVKTVLIVEFDADALFGGDVVNVANLRDIDVVSLILFRGNRDELGHGTRLGLES